MGFEKRPNAGDSITEKEFAKIQEMLSTPDTLGPFNAERSSIERFRGEIDRLEAQIEDATDHSPDDAQELKKYLEELKTIFRKRFNREP